MPKSDQLGALFVLFLCLLSLLFNDAEASPQCNSPVMPLSTSGSIIVDNNGCEVQLKSVNWFGAESAEFVVGGLQQQPLRKIIGLIKQGGFNSVRLPWSNELLAKNPVVSVQYLTANPELNHLHALELLDIVIAELTRNGLMVVLDNHRSHADWCCDEEHGDGLWHTPDYPTATWISDWKNMIARYKNNPYVVAAELRNEIRKDPSQQLTPTWGDNNQTSDWRIAATQAGNALHAINPDVLIIVGGINYQENLHDVKEFPVSLHGKNKLVYAAHDYVWWHQGTTLNNPTLFAQEAFARWGFVSQTGQSYSAPVYISEWGGCMQHSSTELSCTQDKYDFGITFANYLCTTHLSFAYWPLNGTQSAGYRRVAGAVESYGLLNQDWSDYVNPELIQKINYCR